MRRHPLFTFLCPFMVLLSVLGPSYAGDTLSSGRSISDGETLVSSGQSFELGFFSPGNSNNRFLGIWYKIIPETVVWVANGNDPLADSDGTLTITNDGALVLLNRSKSVVWSSNSSGMLRNQVAQLLDSGNLVLRGNSSSSSKEYSWQSFNYPSDTQFAGMNIGRNLATGLESYPTSRRSADDPSPGGYMFRLSNRELPQWEIVSTDSGIKYRTGPWNGVQFGGSSMAPSSFSRLALIYNASEIYFVYEPLSNGVITRVTLNPSGLVQRLMYMNGSATWDTMYSAPNDICDNYAECGSNGFCRINEAPVCKCLQGYTPKSPEEWDLLNRSSGCVRILSLNCSKGEGFLKLSGVKLPDPIDLRLDKNMSLDECKAECLKNCSCAAYANSDVRGGGSGCLMWFGNLIDLRECIPGVDYERNLFIRLPTSELDAIRSTNKKKRLIIIGILSILGLFITAAAIWVIYGRRRSKERGWRSGKDELDLPLYDFATIAAAADNFSWRNMIGEGGFGPVYKGNLSVDQEIAVKRLSKNSGQGLKEFMNEVVLIAKLQHGNLVGLVGCRTERDERILIYEYMPNGSLDHFVMGIARGLPYLHQDSKLQIIHRDLKASNILLDAKLNPKISDFGLARIFGGDEKEVKTRRVIGTYGYMSPQYAFDGKFSVKSDVYGFGVLLLEIISGKKNRGFSHPNHHHNLLGHAWLLWTHGGALELLDKTLCDSADEPQVERCIHVGLLCVQKFPADRPAMSMVASILGSEGTVTPQPKQPGFFMERSMENSSSASTGEDHYTNNSISITMPEAR
ncbi:G-type lectin S-receptor-like serine/threonine-protein kinase At4g27290 [Rhodamnia argentea]|uniref:Receptor-like serine/threonine-protein kinase n=1 Tax=Rhodamnia argentea TaxID=178133 RepID=A0ABM3H0X5_9MYRT|nr:G-type lectin S-receptor-like serine/threonine-protein kinase At4g27290 [Rhodamnia argentea]